MHIEALCRGATNSCPLHEPATMQTTRLYAHIGHPEYLGTDPGAGYYATICT